MRVGFQRQTLPRVFRKMGTVINPIGKTVLIYCGFIPCYYCWSIVDQMSFLFLVSICVWTENGFSNLNHTAQLTLATTTGATLPSESGTERDFDVMCEADCLIGPWFIQITRDKIS
ncbi:hypothetical protein JB92DRAFT_64597 [Gautieria morchelliformis]|nr:hypothetical protein JB92DRAFT_64597 [Gautieria morchelliformis]